MYFSPFIRRTWCGKTRCSAADSFNRTSEAPRDKGSGEKPVQWFVYFWPAEKCWEIRITFTESMI